MPAVKLQCVVERVQPHGDRVYSIELRPERTVPRFRAGQFLHLAIDAYQHGDFWPESRAFSIASSTTSRDLLRITYAVHGRFSMRMEKEVTEGAHVWVKLPYGDFVVDGASDVVLFAGGTGITAFTAFLEDLSGPGAPRVTLAYGARTPHLLVYEPLVEHCATKVPGFEAIYFVEERWAAIERSQQRPVVAGRVSASAVWDRIERPAASTYYVSGPPPMLRAIRDELRARHVLPERIRIDNWE
jgi:ferredoxin-NADP reductase